MTTSGLQAQGVAGQWRGRSLVDRDGRRIGKLQDVYVDVETDEPKFATVKERRLSRRVTFVPLQHVSVGPKELHCAVSRDQVRSAPDVPLHGDGLSLAGESSLYDHYGLRYARLNTESGRRLARR